MGWAAVIMDPHKFVRRMAPWRSRAWLASTDTSLEVDFSNIKTTKLQNCWMWLDCQEYNGFGNTCFFF